MNKILKISLTYALIGVASVAGAQQLNPITEAVLQQYNEILAENPKDYITLFDRASQYYELGDFNRALSDIDMALEYTPAKESEYRVAELNLKSDIQTTQKNYSGALKSVQDGLAIEPSSQPLQYKQGNLYLLTSNPQEALKSFQQLQRISPRSQEAFYGMAKANALLGKNQEASDLLEEVKKFGSQTPVTYCRIGDLYADMGNYNDATANYLLAYTMDATGTRPLESLRFLARKDPSKVMAALNGIIADSPENYAFNFVKAMLAYEGGMYSEAEKAGLELQDKLENESPEVYRLLALSQLAQNKMNDAVSNIKKAEALAPDNVSLLSDKALILSTTSPSEAYTASAKALSLAPENESIMLIAAKTAMESGKYEEAQKLLNNLVLNDPSNGEALILRAYLNTEFLKDGKAGVTDYTRAGNISQNGDVRNMVIAALGKSKSGKKLDADGIIGEAVEKAGNNKDDLYYIAIYYAQTGNLEKAKSFVDKAVANGYSNIYNLKTNNTPLLNLTPIHHLL